MQRLRVVPLQIATMKINWFSWKYLHLVNYDLVLWFVSYKTFCCFKNNENVFMKVSLQNDKKKEDLAFVLTFYK